MFCGWVASCGQGIGPALTEAESAGNRRYSGAMTAANSTTFYAETPARRTRQIIGDLIAAAIVVIAVIVGTALRNKALVARDGADSLERNATQLQKNLSDAKSALNNLPMVGDLAGRPFGDAANTAGQMARSGHDLSTGLQQTASLLGLTVALVPIILTALIWALTRGRYVRAASRASRLRSSLAGQRILALEALTHAPLRRLALVGADPAKLWANGAARDIHNLASRRLEQLGLRAGPLDAGEEAADDVA